MGDSMPAANGTEQRLDTLIGRVESLISLLTPPAADEPRDGDAVELREPEPIKPAKARRS